VKVIATTRNRDRFPMLQSLGASRVEVEGPDLSKRIAEAKKLDAVLELVGFEDIREAHRVMDANQANGKMVVVV
jgi:hypothetical protein